MVAFASTSMYMQSWIPLAAGAASEVLYLATVPAHSAYRRLIDRRERQRQLKESNEQREALIKSFDPREREAVEYLRWMKQQIYTDYKKFSGMSAESNPNLTKQVLEETAPVLNAIDQFTTYDEPSVLAGPASPHYEDATLARRFGSSFADYHLGRVHRVPDLLSSLLAEGHEWRPGTACAGESPSSCSKPRRELGQAGVNPNVAFARALLAPGILIL
jgi:hypothetical protein